MTRYPRTVLILGASTMQLPAIRAAERMGMETLVADRNPTAPGAAEADRFLEVDISDPQAVLAAVSAPDCPTPDGVFTAGTDFSSTVAYVAGELGLPGIPYEVALDASDKARMRGVFRRAGLPSPEFRSLHHQDDPVPVVDELGLPLVVKPVDNMGARGVRRVDTVEELRDAVKTAIAHSRSATAIVESYIEGPEFSLDALVHRGEITLCGIADRHIRFPPYFVEIGHTIPTVAAPDARRAVVELFHDGIRALGITDGAAKGDIKYGPDGPVIGEIAARLSGGYMSGWTYPYASGVDVTSAGLRIAVGLPPGDLTERLARTSAERAFFSIPGTVASLSEVPEREPPIAEVFLRVQPGDEVQFPTNNVEKCGNVIAVHEDHASAVQAAETACRGVVVRLESGDRRTQRFLFGGEEPWVPDAFELSVPGNRAALASMPGMYEGPPSSDVEVSIEPLPDPAAEGGVDWLGRDLSDSVTRVTRLTGTELGRSGRTILGSLFWRAMIRGGVQGGVWVIDTFRAGETTHLGSDRT